jgi:hypothetical protein
MDDYSLEDADRLLQSVGLRRVLVEDPYRDGRSGCEVRIYITVGNADGTPFYFLSLTDEGRAPKSAVDQIVDLLTR